MRFRDSSVDPKSAANVSHPKRGCLEKGVERSEGVAWNLIVFEWFLTQLLVFFVSMFNFVQALETHVKSLRVSAAQLVVGLNPMFRWTGRAFG